VRRGAEYGVRSTEYPVPGLYQRTSATWNRLCLWPQKPLPAPAVPTASLAPAATGLQPQTLFFGPSPAAGKQPSPGSACPRIQPRESRGPERLGETIAPHPVWSSQPIETPPAEPLLRWRAPPGSSRNGVAV